MSIFDYDKPSITSPVVKSVFEPEPEGMGFMDYIGWPGQKIDQALGKAVAPMSFLQQGRLGEVVREPGEGGSEWLGRVGSSIFDEDRTFTQQVGQAVAPAPGEESALPIAAFTPGLSAMASAARIPQAAEAVGLIDPATAEKGQEFTSAMFQPGAEMVSGAAIDPVMWAPLSALLKLGKAGHAILGGISAGFTYEMGTGAYEAAQQTKELFDQEGVTPDTVRAAMQTLGTAGMAGLAGVGTIKHGIEGRKAFKEGKAKGGEQRAEEALSEPPDYQMREAVEAGRPDQGPVSPENMNRVEVVLKTAQEIIDARMGEASKARTDQSTGAIPSGPEVAHLQPGVEAPKVKLRVVTAENIQEFSPEVQAKVKRGAGYQDPSTGEIFIGEKGIENILRADTPEGAVRNAIDTLGHEYGHAMAAGESRPSRTFDPITGKEEFTGTSGGRAKGGHASGEKFQDLPGEAMLEARRQAISDFVMENPRMQELLKMANASPEFKAALRGEGAGVQAGTFSKEAAEFAETATGKGAGPRGEKLAEFETADPEAMARAREKSRTPAAETEPDVSFLGEKEKGKTELNASGESAASAEAMSRGKGMKSRGETFVVYNRAGVRRPLIGPEAVDYVARPGETYGVEGPKGFRTLDDRGGKIPSKDLFDDLGVESYMGRAKRTLGDIIKKKSNKHEGIPYTQRLDLYKRLREMGGPSPEVLAREGSTVAEWKRLQKSMQNTFNRQREVSNIDPRMAEMEKIWTSKEFRHNLSRSQGSRREMELSDRQMGTTERQKTAIAEGKTADLKPSAQLPGTKSQHLQTVQRDLAEVKRAARAARESNDPTKMKKARGLFTLVDSIIAKARKSRLWTKTQRSDLQNQARGSEKALEQLDAKMERLRTRAAKRQARDARQAKVGGDPKAVAKLQEEVAEMRKEIEQLRADRKKKESAEGIESKDFDPNDSGDMFMGSKRREGKTVPIRILDNLESEINRLMDVRTTKGGRAKVNKRVKELRKRIKAIQKLESSTLTSEPTEIIGTKKFRESRARTPPPGADVIFTPEFKRTRGQGGANEPKGGGIHTKPVPLTKGTVTTTKRTRDIPKRAQGTKLERKFSTNQAPRGGKLKATPRTKKLGETTEEYRERIKEFLKVEGASESEVYHTFEEQVGASRIAKTRLVPHGPKMARSRRLAKEGLQKSKEPTLDETLQDAPGPSRTRPAPQPTTSGGQLIKARHIGGRTAYTHKVLTRAKEILAIPGNLLSKAEAKQRAKVAKEIGSQAERIGDQVYSLEEITAFARGDTGKTFKPRLNIGARARSRSPQENLSIRLEKLLDAPLKKTGRTEQLAEVKDLVEQIESLRKQGPDLPKVDKLREKIPSGDANKPLFGYKITKGGKVVAEQGASASLREMAQASKGEANFRQNLDAYVDALVKRDFLTSGKATAAYRQKALKYFREGRFIAETDAQKAKRVLGLKRAAVESSRVDVATERTTRNRYVDRELNDAMEGLEKAIADVDSAGGLKTHGEGVKSKKGGFEQRDLVEDYIDGREIDLNGEYIYNHTKFKAAKEKLKAKIERDYDAEFNFMGEKRRKRIPGDLFDKAGKLLGREKLGKVQQEKMEGLHKAAKVVGIGKTALSAGDLSNPGRQTFVLSADQLLTQPHKVAKNIWQMIGSYKESYHKRVNAELQNTLSYKVADKAGVRFIKDMADHEMFPAIDWVGKGINMGRTFSWKNPTKLPAEILEKTFVGAARAFTHYQNLAMRDGFVRGIERVNKVEGELTPRSVADIADITNVFGTRVKIGNKFIREAGNVIAFSPQMIVSRARAVYHVLLDIGMSPTLAKKTIINAEKYNLKQAEAYAKANPTEGIVYKGKQVAGPKLEKLQWNFSSYTSKGARSYARRAAARAFLVGMASLGQGYAVAKMMGRNPEIETDPRSTDFMKLRVGHTTEDPWGGHQQYLRLPVQLITGQEKLRGSGRVQKANRFNLIGRFMRSKASPAASLFISALGGKTPEGREMRSKEGVARALRNSFLFLLAQDAEEILQEEPNIYGAMLFMKAAIGQGIQSGPGAKGSWIKDPVSNRMDVTVSDEIRRLKLEPPRVGTRVTLPGRTRSGQRRYYVLDAVEKEKHVSDVMPKINNALFDLVQSERYKKLTDRQKTRLLQKIISRENRRWSAAKRLKREMRYKPARNEWWGDEDK